MPEAQQHPLARRTVLSSAAVLAAAARLPALPADATVTGRPHTRLTVLGTTDLHGNVFNWDYFKNEEFDDDAAPTTSGWPRCRR